MRFYKLYLTLTIKFVFMFFNLTENHVFLIVDIGTCKLVWMLLLSHHPISLSCHRSSRGSCWGDNRVGPSVFLLSYPSFCFFVPWRCFSPIALTGPFFPGMLKREKHWCLLLIKSYLLDRLVLGRWYDSSDQSYEFTLCSHLRVVS